MGRVVTLGLGLKGMNDRLVVQEVIKEIAQTHAVNASSASRPFKGIIHMTLTLIILTA
jgi:hypothetical protein